MGSEFSLKTAVVSLFVEGVLEIDGDEKGEGVVKCLYRLCIDINSL